MKLSKVLLRWYKSFNTSYSPVEADRKSGVNKPWNEWRVGQGEIEMFPCVEIPIDPDITTVVGANESGKSHLLNAISLVITGRGIPGDPFSKHSEGKPYSQTDLCHFAALLGKNLEIWPHVGVEFMSLTPEDAAALGKVLGRACQARAITLMLTNEERGKVARLYLDDVLVSLDEKKLKGVRDCLPRVLFINSQLAIADEVPVTDLLAAYGRERPQQRAYYPATVAQKAAQFLSGLVLPSAQAPPPDIIRQTDDLKAELNGKHLREVPLEYMLFKHVLGISAETLENLYGLDDGDRGHAESLIGQWNEEIERTLNLSRYWQQDQEFTLKINYKKGVLFFEITDKTGCVYTFRERSSGLRYFLSYYIQAKALEAQLDGHDAIILMDEPDSFLSILGQRNLLSIFEALVSANLSKRKTQVVYTTHSPFLINRNFPSRIRLVRKGDSEEGTQYIHQSRVRRFEPVRSALGIDLAQTLFMGGTNILLEGPTDQYLIAELIRIFAGAEGTNDLLDLNAIVLVSAESASGVEKVLSASRWADEPIPTAVVILDDDQGGREVLARITGKERGVKQIVSRDLVSLISEIITPFDENKMIATTEDILPLSIYQRALESYVAHWMQPTEGQLAALAAEFAKPEFSHGGLVAGAKAALEAASIISGTSYDKMGVLQEAVTLIRDLPEDAAERGRVKANLLELSRFLRQKIEVSTQAERLRTGKQAIDRIIKDFFIKYKEGSTPYELQLVFERLGREADSFGDDVELLRAKIASAIAHLKKLRDSGSLSVTGMDWRFWRYALEQVRRNPLEPDVSFETPLVVPSVAVDSAPKEKKTPPKKAAMEEPMV